MNSKEEIKDRMTSQKRKGFSVGPAHLPNGSRKRKADRIKKDIIHKAKIKREYTKVRERELAQQSNPHYHDVDENRGDNPEHQEPLSCIKRHPERENMINNPSLQANTTGLEPRHMYSLLSSTDHKRRQKPLPFHNEILQAEKIRAEAHARYNARKDAELQRLQRLQDRERTRKAMAKARGAGNRKRKLGGESKILLEKVRKLVGES